MVVAINSVQKMRTFLDVTIEQSSSIEKQMTQIRDVQKMNEQTKSVYNGITVTMHNMTHQLYLKSNTIKLLQPSD